MTEASPFRQIVFPPFGVVISWHRDSASQKDERPEAIDNRRQLGRENRAGADDSREKSGQV